MMLGPIRRYRWPRAHFSRAKFAQFWPGITKVLSAQVSFRAAKTAKDPNTTCRSLADSTGFLAVFAARNDTLHLCRGNLLRKCHPEPRTRRRIPIRPAPREQA